MSLMRNAASCLKKAGYKKEYDQDGMKYYLKWVYERYAFGFGINKHPTSKYPELGFGLLDKKIALIEGYVEHSADLGFYHLSTEKNLYGNGLIEQELTQPIVDKAIAILNSQISEFEEQQQAIIADFRENLFQLQSPPYFHQYIPNLKSFGYIYRGLLFRIAENGTLVDSDLLEAIKLAEKNGVYNKNFKYKLELIKAYISQQ